MRQKLLDLHIYLSLLCAPYLVLYGLSTLSMVHDWSWMAPAADTAEWEATIDVAGGESDEATGEAIRDALGLYGWVPPWQMQRLSDGELSVLITHPGRRYRVDWIRESGHATVVETRPGIWGVLRGLHGLVDLPGWPLSFAWTLYTEVSVAALVFAVAAGLYFWWLRVPSRRVGAVLLAAGSGGTLLLMLSIVA